MRKYKSYLVMLLAGISMVACNKDDETPVSSDKNNISISISNLQTVTKANGEALLDDEKAKIKTIQIYVTDGAKKVLASTEKTLGTAADNYNYVFQKVSSSATTVYVIANNASGNALVEKDGSISTALAQTNTSASQQDATTGNTSTVLMLGTKAIDFSTTITPNPTSMEGWDTSDTEAAALPTYKAAIEIAPIVSRMQIKSIKSKNDGKVTSFKVADVYFNNTFKTTDFRLAGTNGLTNFNPDGSDTGYYNATNFAEFVVSDANGITIPDGKCIGYNFFAETKDKVALIPHVLVHLTNITYATGTTGPANGWLTIKKYKNGAADYGTFKNNTIYTIETIEFDRGDITTNPYQDMINVVAEISVAAWNTVTLIPNL